MSKKIRLNLDITEQVRDRIMKIQKLTGATSSIEVIRRALAIYDLLADGGCKITKSDGSQIEIYLA